MMCTLVLKTLCINTHTREIGMGIQAVYKGFTVQPSSLCHKAVFFNGVKYTYLLWLHIPPPPPNSVRSVVGCSTLH